MITPVTSQAKAVLRPHQGAAPEQDASQLDVSFSAITSVAAMGDSVVVAAG
jgi:hypothetical protein